MTITQNATGLMENESSYAAVLREQASRPGSLLDSRLNRGEPEWLTETRLQAMAAFEDLGFPSPRDEDWRFTNVAPLVKVPFRPAPPSGIHCTQEMVDRAFLPDSEGLSAARLVFINGRYSPQFSRLGELGTGIMAGSLAEALLRSDAWLRPYLARLADYRRHAFAALNTALWEDGAYLHLPKDAALNRPIEMVYISVSRGGPLVAYPRTLVVAERGAQATLVESYIGLDGGISFSNAVSEIVVGEDAVLDHYRLQRDNAASFHVGTLQVYQSRGAQFSSCSVSLGGELVRNEVHSVLDAEGAGCTLNGLFVTLDREHVDNHTAIEHAKPHGSSRQLYNGILGGESSAVFRGGILVRPNAQKTDAIQKNRNLLLSSDATIDSKPQLEIFANDVRCTHGATIGQLDPDALFYLCSRGVGEEKARRLLIQAFAGEILERIRPTAVRLWVEKVLQARLGSGLED